MSEEVTARPLVQFAGDEDAGHCNRESGVCLLPLAPETKDSGGRPHTAAAR